MAISGTRMYDFLKKINFVRLSTFEGEKKAANIIMDELRSMGIEGRMETFKAPRYEIKTAKLEVLTPVYKEYEVTGYGFAGNAAKDGIEAEFAYVEALDPIDLVHVKNKIVFFAGGIGADAYKKLIDAGVLGFIAPSGTFRETKDTLDLDERMLRPMHTENGQLPGVCIRMTDALEMVASKPEKVRLTLEQTEGEADSQNIVAEIPGTEFPDEVIVYTGHYDSVVFSPGMYDNGSGSATLLELIRHFKENPPKRTVRFIWCGSEERGLLGSKAYVAMHEDLLDNIRLCINIDMTGPLLGRDCARVTGEESLCHALQYFYKEIGYPMSVWQDIYSSDAIPFADKGIPGINFLRSSANGTSQIHCRYDVLETITAESMERTADFIAKFSDRMVNAAFFPIEKKMPDNMVEKVDKYLRKKK